MNWHGIFLKRNVQTLVQTIFTPRSYVVTSKFFCNYKETNIEDELGQDEEYTLLSLKHFGKTSFHNCFIVNPYIKWGTDKVRDTDPEKQTREAVALIRTLDPWKVRNTVSVPLLHFHKNELFGSGTLQKLKSQIGNYPDLTAIFVNISRLKVGQTKQLEKEFGLVVLDRYKVVMQILKLHATSTHAKLQVALAELPYLKSHMLEDGFKGNLDTRRLILQNREQKIKSAINKHRSHRELLRQNRKKLEFPVVAVVGYTNCGKTSLVKALTNDDSLKPQDRLFATLDVTVHEGRLPSSLRVLFVDTVGFISDIPSELIECFIATLEDAMLSDLIIHVEDLSSDDLLFQRRNVLETLENLAARTNSRQLLNRIITVGNKCDLVPQTTESENIRVSSTSFLGIDYLRNKIDKEILNATSRQIITIRVSSGGDAMRWLYKNSAVVSVTHDESSYQHQKLKVVITNSKLQQFKHYFINK